MYRGLEKERERKLLDDEREKCIHERRTESGVEEAKEKWLAASTES